MLLTHPPVGAEEQRALLTHWMQCCDQAGLRLPHALLPVVLDFASGRGRQLRVATAPVADSRGRWLGAQVERWAWLLTAGDDAARAAAATTAGFLDPGAWAQLRPADRVSVLRRVRRDDPAAGRLLLESTWASDPVSTRREHLETLRQGLGPDDEDVLERALDDRAAAVRQSAAELLDGLPDSRRGQRMAARLEPLLQSKGLIRKGVDVLLPGEPDGAALRDGLGKPPPRVSARGWWLEQLVAGATLTLWTDRFDVSPAVVVQRLGTDGAAADARRGLVRAAVVRRDSTWAAALIDHAWDPTLLDALSPAGQIRRVPERIATTGNGPEVVRLVHAVSPPWDAGYSSALVAALRVSKGGIVALPQVGGALAAGLHQDAVSALEAWLPHLPHSTASRALRSVLQFQSLQRSITEAFR